VALPSNVAKVTVHGTILRSVAGAPATGTITFSIPLVLRDYPALMILVPDAVTAALDGSGQFSVVLPATDDPDIDPVGWVYDVVEGWPGGRTLQMSLPASPSTVEWIDVAPAALNPMIYIGGPIGAPGAQGVAGPQGPAGILPVQIGGTMPTDPSILVWYEIL
jgi:hypothetical protein